MPSQTFLNLPKEKQEVIIEASLNEFKRVLLKDASINKIIANANISRGSFYNYFTDINDIYFYSLNNYKEILFNMIEKTLKEKKGNLIETTRTLFDKITKFCLEDENKNLFKNIFINLNYQSDIKNKKYYQNIDEKYRLVELISKINISDLKIKTEEELFYILDIVNSIIVHAIIEIFLDNSIEDEVKEKVSKQLEILKRGIWKEEK